MTTPATPDAPPAPTPTLRLCARTGEMRMCTGEHAKCPFRT